MINVPNLTGLISRHSHSAVPKTEMVGETIRYVKGGSNVILRCIVKDAIEPPIYISWFYNGHQIYNENNHGWKMTFERNILTGSDGPSQGLSPGDGSISPLSSAASASSASPGFYHRSSSAAANVRFKSVSGLRMSELVEEFWLVDEVEPNGRRGPSVSLSPE